ncbi:SDR family oxidoreductase [Brevibacterium sp. 2SA]|uniref:SDR family oxidoreductase n=1 Tax=Brevibacterium sp. 2SA TaxID=2502198 RepID=UPI0020172E21|nr:SDR family oxidoreductase [Brevibacterium sp. 2SA]
MTHSSMTHSSPSTRPEPTPLDSRPLAGRTALVAGATRGAGRVIARELAAAGAFVWCTGRSTAGRPSDYGRPETIDGTVELIRAAGGEGQAVVCDHLDEESLSALAERVEAEGRGLDILVGDIGGEAYVSWGQPLWEADAVQGRRLLETGLLSHVLTARALLPLLTRTPGGLHLEITDGTSDYNATHFRESIWLDLTKTAISRFAFGLSHELGPVGATAVALTPGWLRSEMMLEGFATSEEAWLSDALDESNEATPRDFAISETPHLIGRGIAALAADPDRHRFTGRTLSSFDLAVTYDLTDLDGSRPDVWGFLAAKEDDPCVDPMTFR